jgi:hypothetical protein
MIGSPQRQKETGVLRERAVVLVPEIFLHFLFPSEKPTLFRRFLALSPPLASTNGGSENEMICICETGGSP